MLSLVRVIFTLAKREIDVKEIKTRGFCSKIQRAERRESVQNMVFRREKARFSPFFSEKVLFLSVSFLIVFANILIVSAEAIRMFADRLIVFTDSLIGQVGRVGLV